jgi:hypothetical protein
MFSHILNDILLFWIKNTNPTKQDTLDFALDHGLIEKPSKAFFKFITEEYSNFIDRDQKSVDWIKDISKDNHPVGSNPFMEFDNE